MANVMLDLETLGNNSSSVILSIGAVEFIPASSQIGRKFEAIIDPQTCVDVGLKIDVSTVLWWMEQSDAARAVFKKPKVSLKLALDAFSAFVKGLGTEPKIWGNGAGFDNVILGNAYSASGIERPWKFYNDRDYRTLKMLHPYVKQDPVGVSHDALSDAEYQARLLMKILVQAGIKNV